MNTTEERLVEAAQDRDAGIAQVENAADPRIILAIDEAIEAAIASGRRFSANDIRDQFPTAEHLIGARFNSYANKQDENGNRLMVRVGYTPSTKRSTHHHEIKVWLGWDAYQALHRAASAAS